MSAGDFYFAISARFRHIHDTYGEQALVEYSTSMSRENHAEVAERSRRCPWQWLPPGIAIVISVLSASFTGDALRDALDPRMLIK